MSTLKLSLGVKADPIEYRYSYEWLFRLLREEGAPNVQLGSFFELYQLPDDYFLRLRESAERYGVRIASVFTSHRELGGFMNPDPEWQAITRRNFERLIDVGALVGAAAVGCNPGAVLRDHMEDKDAGIACYLRNMKELMFYAHARGVPWLTTEPMSCLAEPPTLPDEIDTMMTILNAHHEAHPDSTSRVGLCVDVAHGYADSRGRVVWGNDELLDACVPNLYELHLKNTDALFCGTFGFSAEERARGIVDVEAVRDHMLASAEQLPVQELVSYLELGGPKLGRDYSDHLLGDQLRESLTYLREAYLPAKGRGRAKRAKPKPAAKKPVWGTARDPVEISPSVMCCDLCHLEDSVRALEAIGAHYLHIDIMDTRFTPNMPLGLEMLSQLKPHTRLPYDVHLMVEDNDFFIEKLLPLQPAMISVHAESATHLDRTLSLIRSGGARAGVALNPATPLEAIRYVLDRLDFVLIMTVNPGFAGQKMVPSGFDKIADCAAFLKQHGRADIQIQVDGNVSFENIPGMVKAGARNLVAGTSSIFNSRGSIATNAAQTREAIAAGLRPARNRAKTTKRKR